MKKKFLSLGLMMALCAGATAQTAIIEGSEVAGKSVTKIEFPNNGESVKVTYSDGTTSENLNLDEVTISFDNVTDAIDYVNTDNEEANAPTLYFDLQGRRLAEAPAKGVFIMKKGNKVVKVLNK